MKVLFISGCPRSGTTFYSMQILKDVKNFYVDYTNYEPIFLHDKQYSYFSDKDYKSLTEAFLTYVEEQSLLCKPDDWIVIKQPFFSFILPELHSLPFEKKLLVTKRPFEDIFKSRMNFKDSISQVVANYEATWLHLYGLNLKDAWDAGSYEERMKLYVSEQQKIEDAHSDICCRIEYGENLAENKCFQQEMALDIEQIEKINKNFQAFWKNDDYKNNKIQNKIQAEEFLKNLESNLPE